MNHYFFKKWLPKNIFHTSSITNLRSLNFNFGPQHPGSHGLLRLVLRLRGEIIESGDCHIGLLHRGTEKLCETKTYLQNLGYFERFDYISTLISEHLFCLAVEDLIGNSDYISDFLAIRVIYDELTRILSHFLQIGAQSFDCGSMIPLFWLVREREIIMEFYERVSGARMHTLFYRPNEIRLNYTSATLVEDILRFAQNMPFFILKIINYFNNSFSWYSRLTAVGRISKKQIYNYGLFGFMARAAGIQSDLRLSIKFSYANYFYYNFNSFFGNFGDSLDRYNLRLLEIIQSINLINQACKKFGSYFITYKKLAKRQTIFKNNFFVILEELNIQKFNQLKSYSYYQSMENLINTFIYYSDGFQVKPGFSFKGIEGPRGETSLTCISDGTTQPFRCHVRSSIFYNLNAFILNLHGHMFGDIPLFLASIDPVMGEVDR